MRPSQTALAEALEKGRSAKVLVIGDLMLDEYIWGNVDRISPEAPVQVVEWQSYHDGLGGAANVAQNLVALGCEVWLAGMCGRDDKGSPAPARARSASAGSRTTPNPRRRSSRGSS